ncbi:MAG: aminopeptidase P family protein [Lentisphaerota bacterium]
MFEPKIYKDRRVKLTNKLGKGIVLFLGNSLLPIDYKANTYPFNQDDSFRYYFGINEPGFAAVMDLDTGDEILFGKEHSINDKIWSRDLYELPEVAELSGVCKTKNISELKSFLSKGKQPNRLVHHVSYDRADNKCLINELLGSYTASIKLTKAIIEQRSAKSEEEIFEIEEAISTAGTIFKIAKSSAIPGIKESDILNRMLYETAMAETKPSFQPIVTVHGETLHNDTYNNTLKKNDLLLIDFGIYSKEGYCSDNTRTYSVGEDFLPEQKDIYSLVLQAQLDAISAVRPGIRNLDVHKRACLSITEGLINLKIMKGNPHDAVETGAHALFFPHGIGHMLGLNTHDMESFGEDLIGYGKEMERSSQFGLSSLRLARELKEGFVITIEPGIYFIPQLIDLWESEGKHKDFINYDKVAKFRNFGGIRIEDDVLVTNSGSRVLGKPIPK